MINTRSGRAVAAALMAAAGTALVAVSPAGANVACGSVITKSTTLTSDLHCPAGDGLHIGASGVTLNLGGHTISGTIAPDAPGTPGNQGVAIGFNRANVTVRNGTVRGFNVGIGVQGSGAFLSGITVERTAMGIGVFGTDTSPTNVRIIGNDITGTTRFSGIQMAGSGHQVSFNTFSGGEGSSIFFFGHNNVISSNTFNGVGRSAIALGPTPSTFGPFSGNQVLSNRVDGFASLSPSSAISIINGSDTLVRSNTIDGGGTSGAGVTVNASTGTTVNGNRVSMVNQGVLVRTTASGTVVSANRVQDSQFGVFVESGPTATRLEDNVTSLNSFDGIRVSSSSTSLRRNIAYSNGQWGIFATAGATDLGGNRAFGNGFGQCTANVAC
ncbi:MAG: right-handed parallel beta-helix repeat-containing protein [Actinomycetota bacterium]